MAARRAYLDYNASAPLLAVARAAMLDGLSATANPSSVHQEGRAARRIVEQARREVAALVRTKSENVIFTSGATEAATMLLTPDWRMGRSGVRMSRLYVTQADHPCVFGGGRFAEPEITRLPVDRDGIVDLAALREALARHDRATGLPLVAIHAANNETGVIQPLGAVAEAVRDAGGVFVVDAVQAAGRVEIDMSGVYGDFLILSSHKLGGPKGAGAVVGRSDLLLPSSLIRGGGQEKGHRAGTENVTGIAGFGAAAVAAKDSVSQMGRQQDLRDAIEAALLKQAPEAEIFGRDVGRIGNTTFFAIPGVKAETAQIAFDLAGVALSAGSACSSGKVGPSHVLKAMGRGDSAGALRVSVGPGSSEADVEQFGDALAAILARRDASTAA